MQNILHHENVWTAKQDLFCDKHVARSELSTSRGVQNPTPALHLPDAAVERGSGLPQASSRRQTLTAQHVVCSGGSGKRKQQQHQTTHVSHVIRKITTSQCLRSGQAASQNGHQTKRLGLCTTTARRISNGCAVFTSAFCKLQRKSGCGPTQDGNANDELCHVSLHLCTSRRTLYHQCPVPLAFDCTNLVTPTSTPIGHK